MMEFLKNISKIYEKAESLCLKTINLVRPPQDFIITGIPRCGTSLLCALLTRADNCVCFNEIHYELNTLAAFFKKMRKDLLGEVPIPNKIDESGKLITSPDDTNKDLIYKKVFQVVGSKIVIGSKVTVPYLNQIDKILKQNYKVIAMVRDPVYTLGSWNSEKLSNTPMNKVDTNNLHPHWKDIRFFSDKKFERQSQIWEHYASLIWSLRDKLKIIKYEELIDQQELVMKELGDFLKIGLPEKFKDLANYNQDFRYKNLDEIRDAVKKYCPSRKYFGYP